MILINQDLVAQVRHAWIADQQHPQRGRRNRPIPDSERFGLLLDIVFRTSMIPEAGRHVRANVAWLSMADFQEHEMKRARASELALRLERNRPLDATVLARLGKTTENGSSSLLVDWFDGTPMVWGMIYYQRGARTLNEIPAAIEEGVHGAPDCPILSIDGIGSFSITRGDALIGRITRGEFARAVRPPAASFYSHPMGMILHDLFGVRMALKGGAYVDDGDNSYGHGRLECLKYLLEQLHRQAGGALVLFIPEAFVKDAIQQADLPWASTGSLEVRDLLRTRIRHRREAQEKQGMSTSYVAKTEALIRERLDAIARLASIEGALLLAPDFELLGFGSKLRAAPWNGTVIEGPDGFGGGGQPFDFLRLGARHASAVAYVAALPGTVAFVVSADGPIRALARKGHGPIHCWPDCRLSILAS